MANIDNLNFGVILDDADFRKKVQEDIALAKELNIKLSDALEIKKKTQSNALGEFSEGLKNAAKRLIELHTQQRKHTSAELAEIRNLKKLVTLYQQVENRAKKASAAMDDASNKKNRYIKEITGFMTRITSLSALFSIAKDITNITAEFELQHTALRAILQDLKAADTLYSRIKSLAVESPFQFKELVTYTKQLSAYSIPVEELYDTTKMLADLSAGLGVGMDRLVLAYGQIRSAAFLRGQEVRQLTEAGIPILDELRKKFEELGEVGITTGQVFDKISMREVPFEMVRDVLVEMTSEGGKFYRMQEIQAETLRGKLSNLSDAYQVMLSEIGEKHAGALKGALGILMSLMKNYESAIPTLLTLAGTFGLVRVAVALYNTEITKIPKGLKNVKKAIDVLTKAMGKNGFIIAATAVATLISSIVALITHLNRANRLQKEFNQTIQEFHATVDSETITLSAMLKQLSALEKGTDSYKAVMSDLMKMYAPYLSDMDKEALKAGNLALVYENLAVKIKESNNERYRQMAYAQLEDYQGDMNATISKNRRRYFEKFDAGDALAKAVAEMYMRGDSEDFIRNFINESITDGRGGITPDMNISQWIYKTFVEGRGNKLSRQHLNAANNFKNARNASIKLKRYTEETVKNINEIFGIMEDATKDTKPLDEWQEAVNELLGGFGKNDQYSWWTNAEKNNEGYFAYIDKLRKNYSEIVSKLKDVGNYIDSTKLNEEKTIIERIADLLGISLTDSGSGGGDLLDRIKVQVDWLKELQDEYQKLSKYRSDGELSKIFTDKYGNDLNNMLSYLPEEERMNILVEFDFERNLQFMANRIREIGTQEAIRLAESIERGMGKDWAGELADYFRALDDYNAMMRDWGMEDFNIDGTGVGFDISKIALEYSNAMTDAEKKREEAIKKAEALREQNGVKWYMNEMQRINILYARQVGYERNLRQEKINRLGEQYAKELIEKNPAVLTKDFGDASFKQVKNSITAIDELIKQVDKEDVISDDTKKKLEEAGITLNEFYTLGKEGLQKLKEQNIEEYWKKVTEGVQNALGVISDLGGTISNLGQEIEDVDLQRLGEGLSAAASGVSSIISGFTQGGIAGGVIATVTFAFDRIANSITRVLKTQQALTDATEDYHDTLRALAREDFDTIFGNDALGRLKNDFKELNRLTRQYNNNVAKASAKAYRNMGGGLHRLDSQVSALDTLAWNSDLGDASAFYNAGVLDMEKVRSYFNAVGSELPRKQRKILEELIENYDEMNEYLSYTEEYFEDIFGNLASSIADMWLESWKDMTSTAEDEAEKMKDIFYDLGEALVQSLVQSLVMEVVLSKYKAQLAQLYEDYTRTGDENALMAGLGALFANLKQDLADLQPVVQDIYNTAFEKDVIPRDGSDSVNTIQGDLSEETVNRLLNLVNAMRAEQFRQGTVLDKTSEGVLNIASLLGRSNEQYLNYLASISANTYDTSQKMSELLSRWADAVDGTSSAGSLKVRVINP